MSEFEYLRGPVRWIRLKTVKAGSGGSSGNRAARQLQAVVKKKTEVMVKMTGVSKSHKHAAVSLQYISREGKLELETGDGDIIKGKQDVAYLADCWRELDTFERQRKNARIATSLVFSMPPGTPENGVHAAVRTLAAEEFGGKHNYAFALHMDTNKPHVHVIIHNSGLPGHNRLHLSRERMQELRERFRDNLERQGIEAAASPRQVRGKVQRSEKTEYYRVKERLHKQGQRTDVETAQARESYSEVSGKSGSARPWEKRISNSQQAIKKTWADYGERLAASENPEKKQEAEAVRGFLNSFPAQAKTRREQLDESMVKAMAKRTEQGRQQPDPGTIRETAAPPPRHGPTKSGPER